MWCALALLPFGIAAIIAANRWGRAAEQRAVAAWLLADLECELAFERPEDDAAPAGSVH
jgi:hypothetical protein